MHKICLIEDDIAVAEIIRKGLKENNYTIDVFKDGMTGKQSVVGSDYDVIILDVMLPVLSGIDICRDIRKVGSGTPILMLTALGTIDDKVAGLKAGADDYLVKPFHFKELLARIEALTRRHKAAHGGERFLKINDLKIDTWSRSAERGDKKILLTAKEYLLLELFVSNRNRVLSRQFIAEKVWGFDFDTGTNVIDVYVNYLRNKIDKGFQTKLINTVIGMGYMFKENQHS